MDFFARCLAVFVGLTVLLIVVDVVLLQTAVPFGITLLLSTFISLLLTILYGWIDEVYLQHGRQIFKE